MRGANPERLSFLGYFLLQELVVLGLNTPRWADSPTYLHLSLTGAASRLPTVPLFYKLFPTDDLRVAAQVVLAALAWWMLALCASRLVIDRRVQIVVRVVLLMLGLVPAVTNWNSIILSESVAVSLTALLIAAWMAFVQHPGWVRLALALAVTLFWTLARQPNVLFGLGITLAGLVALAVGKMRVNLRTVSAIGLLVISAIGLLEIHRNESVSKAALGDIVQLRILPNPQWTAWFVAHGMPYSPTVANYSGQEFRYVDERGSPFVTWIYAHGRRTYFRFILTHPRYTLVGPLPYFSGEEASDHHMNASIYRPYLQPNPTPSILSPTVNYGRHREVLPSVIENLLFEQGQIGDVFALGVAAIGLALLTVRRSGSDARFAVPAVAVLLAIPEGYILWLSGGETTGELDRLSIVTAVSLRIGLWVMLAVAVDRLMVQRRVDRSLPVQPA